MASDTLKFFGHFPIEMLGGLTEVESEKVDWLTDTINIALVTNAWTPAVDTNKFWDDISANEVANGNGYTTGGKTLGTKTLVYTAAGNISTADAADPTAWTGLGAGFTFRYAVIYSATSDVAIGYLDYGASQLVGLNETLTITFDVLGVFTATAP